MTVATWPSELPVPLRDGYLYDLPELVLRTEFAAGNRTRPLYTDGPDTFRLTMLFTSDQCERFKAWLRYDAADGANWFTLPLLVGDTVVSREVQLTAPPSIALEGVNHWRVTLALETRTGTTMSRAAYDAL